MKPRPFSAAFSLIELSIVIAIIGILAGSITVGSSLMHRSKLNAVVNTTNKYRNAFLQFKEVYQAVPGDYADATEQWGTDPDGCPTHTNRVPKKQTCNGTGDAHIGYGTATGTAASYPEFFRAWQHLSNAGLIEGMYTGVTGPGGVGHSVAEQNSPAGPIDLSAYSFAGFGTYGNANLFTAEYGNSLQFGKTNTSTFPQTGLITPSDMQGLDVKVDDGLPHLGKMLTGKTAGSNYPGCADATNTLYNVQSNTKACGFFYRMEANK